MAAYKKPFIAVIYIVTIPYAISQSWMWTFYPQMSTWNDAARFCNDNGGRLLKLDSYAKYDILEDISDNFNEWGNSIWLGLYHDTDSRRNLWQGECDDVENITEYSNWDSPERPDTLKPCTMMDGGSFTWKPEICKQDYAIICESRTDSSIACSSYIEQLGDGTQLCVAALVDTSSTPPRNYPDMADVDSPPCYTVSNVGNAVDTTVYGITTPSVIEKTTSETMTSKTGSGRDGKGSATPQSTSSLQSKNISIPQSTSSSSSIFSAGQHSSSISENTPLLKSTSSVEFNTIGVNVATSEGSAQVILEQTSQMNSFLFNTTDESDKSSSCPCRCTNTVNITKEELLKKLHELQDVLSINRKDTVKSKLKLISAEDDRTSSKAIGFFGVIVLSVLTMLIVLLDVLKFSTLCK